MITPEYLRTMSLHSRWQNEQLYSLCEALGDEQRKLERGMFFGSVHKTLDHVLYIDRALLRMVLVGQRSVLNMDEVLYEDFAALKAERQRMDAGLEAFADQHSEEWLCEKASSEFRFARGFYLVQLFNHQTHHRSQVTSELHKLGVDYGCTDMPYNPYLSSV